MSEQLRHKMIDLEVAPPPAAWQAIAARLYDDEKYMFVATKMNNLEVAPPPASWESIAARINDDKQYTVVSAKMNGFEATPPTQIWDNVLTALEEKNKNEIPVINIRRTVYRITAAAVFIVFFIGAWMMRSPKKNTAIETVKNTDHNTVPVQRAITSNKENKITPDNVQPNQKEESVASQNNYPAQHSAKSNYSSLPADSGKENMPKNALVNSLPHSMPASVVYVPPILDKSGHPVENIDVLTTNSSYVIIAGPNGQLTRISSKFANVIRFLNDDGSDNTPEYIDQVIIESNTWKKRFQEWRNKIAASSYIPSSDNFLDIVELKDLIQERP